MASHHLHVKTTRRVFPASPSQGTVTSKLSIVDATTARFAPCAAVWLYDKPGPEPATLFQRLEETLAQTLDDYRHFAGHAHWATEDLVKDDLITRTLGRPVVTHGTPEDPGVELVVAEDGRELNAIVPTWQTRSTTQRVWNATAFPQNEFLPATPLALSGLTVVEGQPAALVQLTGFKCGGFAIGVKLTHCLSDAVTLLHFVHSWAARSRAWPSGVAHDVVPPVFDPSLLDRAAGLREDGNADASKAAAARALPMHRFDWWADSAPGYPSWAMAGSQGTMPSADELERIQLSPSSHPPWLTWDNAAPVEHAQVRFTAKEIAAMKAKAQATLPGGLEGLTVSRLDAALSFVWILINRARQHQDSQELVYLDVTLGLRPRVHPPLPDSFVGSSIVIAHVSQTGASASTSPLGTIAASLRQTMSGFTPAAVSAYLHDAAHEVSPQRLWQGFLGSQHTLVTSWTRSRAYEVDFVGQGGLARYVQGVMPRIDGLVQIMDVGETGDLDFSVCLEREAMGRLVKDPLLRAYDG